LLFGISAPLAKKLVGNLSLQLLAGLLYLGSGLGLGGLGLVRRARRTRREASLRLPDVPVLATAIAFGGVLAPLLLLLGLQRTPAAAASLLLNLEAVFTALLAWVVFRESLDWKILLGMISIICGGVILSFTETAGLTGWGGPLGIAAACLCWGIDNNVTQKISARAVQIVTIKGFTAGTLNISLALMLGNPWPNFGLAASALLLFVSYGLSLVFYIRALSKFGNGADWQLFFSGSVHRRRCFNFVVERTCYGAGGDSWTIHGYWSLATRDRMPRTLARS
jgi:drug/metabolite transporter (DMT)-like permease